METIIRKIQTAIFTRNFNVTDDTSRAQLLLDINTHSRSIFNAPPVQVPIPSDAPPEFPRIILSSDDVKFGCNIALSRTDIFFNIPDSTQSFADLLQVQKVNSNSIFRFLAGRSITVNRVGFIVVAEKILSSTEGDSNAYLGSHFIRDGKFITPKELMFRYNRAGRSENFDMNNLITINGKPGNKIIIQTDINTVAEIMQSSNFNESNFEEIMDYSIANSIEYVDNFPNI